MAAPTAGYSLQTSSSSSAAGTSNSGFDNSGFVVNFGGAGGVSTASGAMPSWLWPVLAVGVALWFLKGR